MGAKLNSTKIGGFAAKLTLSMCGVAIVTFIGSRALGKTDTKAEIAQLKTNAQNSEFNRKQYQDNLDIVNKNIAQAGKAIGELSNMKRQLFFNTRNVDKNEKELTLMEQDVKRLEAKEQFKMNDENKQISVVEKYLAKLQANEQKREANLKAYNKMLVEAQNEAKEWKNQVKQMSHLEAKLSTKKQQAEKARMKWIAKRKDYAVQAHIWTIKAHHALATYNKYKSINDE